ncbi:hypothetical protein FIA61_01430 [Bacteroides thetaiotaomicron]|nr:hypothetical protein FIB20_09215 [Bacteroides thetaiotaomicron]KAA0106460.1 hypothetical protein FIA61_01430 [Bacteroides thetaiotaomicron]
MYCEVPGVRIPVSPLKQKRRTSQKPSKSHSKHRISADYGAFFIFAPQQGEGLNVGFSLQSSVIICYIYCYTLKTPQKNVAVTEK